MPGKKRAAAPAEEEETFVRGGGSGLAPVEYKRLQKEAYAEAEADLFRGSKKRRKPQAGEEDEEEDGDEEDAFFSSLSAQDKLPKYAELLKFKNLAVGTKLWGSVVEVLPKELVISLPHGLRGHVSYREASDVLAELAAAATAAREGDTPATKHAKRKSAGGADHLPPLADLFRIGQLVRCTVVGLRGGHGEGATSAAGNKRKRVDVSLHLSRLHAGLTAEALKEGAALPAVVRSMEDHGYLLGLGIGGTSAFLPKKAAPEGLPLQRGTLVEVVVQQTKAGGAVIVTADPGAVASANSREWEGVNIGSLVPGALVTARVRHVLSDGLLLSFLTFFTGTVDPFHLGTAAKAAHGEGQRVKARILYVDPTSKRVGLTLLRHLLDAAPQTDAPPVGTIFETAEVVRVDPGLGLLIDLKESGGVAARWRAYAHLSELSDDKIQGVEGRFRVGQIVRCRVLGARPMDGLAVASLKPSVLTQSVLSVSDLSPGMAVSGVVERADEGGLLLQLTPSVHAAVPAAHLSDVAPSAKAHRKFKVGQRVQGRVLQVDGLQKRVTVTLKQTLVDSKLPIISTAEAVVPGSRAHGVVTGMQEYGVFLSFFGGVSGLVGAKDCGLPEGQRLGDAFALGQVVKCRVLGVDPGKKGLRLSLISRKKAAEEAATADGLGGVHPGALLSGTVISIHRTSDGESISWLQLDLHLDSAAAGSGADAGGVASGRLDVAHLADHPAAAAALAEVLQVGTRLEGLLVLQRLETARQLRVSRKSSLVTAAAAGLLPSEPADLSEGLLFPGYVASVTGDAVFVRCLGNLTGRAGLAQLSDTFVSDPSAHFTLGQSVRARVVQVDQDKGRFTVTLKRSLCSSSSSAGGEHLGSSVEFLSSLLRDLELAHALEVEAAAQEEGGAVDWAAFPIGGTADGEVHGVKDYGILCDLTAHPDVVGLAAPHQAPAGTATAAGAPIHGLVLDISKKDGIVDLSLRPELLQRAAAAAAAAAAGSAVAPIAKGKKKAPANKKTPLALQLGQAVQATVELVKPEEGYCVVSLGEGTAPTLAFLPTADFNLQPGSGAEQPQPGQVVAATVAVLPGESTGGRLLLQAPLGQGKPTASGAAGDSAARESGGNGGGKEGRGPLPQRGAIVSGKVESLHALHADVVLQSGHHGRIHITEASDGSPSASTSPLAALAAGAAVEAAVLGRMQSAEGRRHGLLELSMRPSVLAAARADAASLPAALNWAALQPGVQLPAFVQEVTPEHVWVVVSPTMRGRALATQAASSLQECAALSSLYRPGQAVHATVLAADSAKRVLDVNLTGQGGAPVPGSHALGLITAVTGAGVRVQLGPRASGKVALSDVHDVAVSNALAGLAPKQFVRVAVLRGGEGSRKQLTLSLRPSSGGQCAAHAAAAHLVASSVPAPPEELSAAQLKPGQKVSGYVKSAGPTGVFVCLSRSVDARIKLRQLAETFVDDPAAAYPEGARVEGSVLSVEGSRVDLTLRQRRPVPSLDALEEGQAVRGKVRRVEPFGVFVELEGSGACGLAHVSELADEFVKEPAKLFNVGQPVVARVMKVDKAANRLSLSLKPSYFEGMSEEEGAISEEEAGPDFDEELEAALAEEGEEGSEEEGDELDGSEAGSGDEEMEDGEGGFDLDEELLAAEDSDSD